jgi:hypothetical protein
VEAVRIINPREAIPIHYNDYEVFKSPLEDFKRAIEEAGLGDRITLPEPRRDVQFRIPADRSQAA